MARDINWNNPDSWDDDDKTYLRERLDRVPEQHRHLLEVSIPQTPVQSIADVSAADLELAKLASFIRQEYPEETGTPVEIAIRLLSDDDAEDDDPKYEQWKSAELKAEVEKRQAAGRKIEPEGKTREHYAAALRADDEAE